MRSRFRDRSQAFDVCVTLDQKPDRQQLAGSDKVKAVITLAALVPKINIGSYDEPLKRLFELDWIAISTASCNTVTVSSAMRNKTLQGGLCRCHCGSGRYTKEPNTYIRPGVGRRGTNAQQNLSAAMLMYSITGRRYYYE
jgi:hypothetical protein